MREGEKVDGRTLETQPPSADVGPKPTPSERLTGRESRQVRIAEWCLAAFGLDHTASIQQRGVRFLEEAIEAYQACGCDQEMAHKLVDYIFAKPIGDLAQEIGQVGLSVLALANAAQVSADAEEAAEVARVLTKPLSVFHARNVAKNAAGFDARAYPTEAAADDARGMPTPPTPVDEAQ